MKDIQVTHFSGWSAVLDFLVGLKPVDSIYIRQTKEKTWTVKTETDGRAKEVRKRTGAGLYDLYW